MSEKGVSEKGVFETGAAITAVNLVKTYGKGEKSVRALDGLSFSVPSGSVFGLLGPNGAGKSSTVKILTTLSRPDTGEATVAGIDVRRHPGRVRRAIGYVSQKPAFDPIGTGRENLVLQARIHGMGGRDARARADELLERFGLAGAANRRAGKWSGGMQRKLDVAMGLLHRPRVLFLDEPTTGLDPEARADMWAEISRLATDDGLTVLLTTHYLDEADKLASRLVIVDRGAVVAAGSPDELKSGLDGDTVQAEVAGADQRARACRVLAAVPGVRQVHANPASTVDSTETGTLRARVTGGAATLPGLLAALEDAGVELKSVTVARPSLDDVYLRYAGRSFGAADVAKEEVAA
ncbi:ATP-binding cassette domain-containing protein [Amycolatopsis nigrescens]|uniref:ABC transporter ATP-binding protein n=1 Tax=Amycolatopsis nigrescens TaxID=381445 RepID=UPI0006866DF5|nr:ATP-binding cassette domain-containing protein [Amycolatopsis nigrescens]